jgi:hypothetical protein
MMTLRSLLSARLWSPSIWHILRKCGQIDIIGLEGMTEKITDSLLRKVNADSGDYASNSWEMASIQRSQRQFSEIIVVVKRYR